MKTLFHSLILFSLLTAPALAQTNDATQLRIKGYEQNVRLIKSLLYSGIKMGNKQGIRSLSIKGLVFRHSNGHNCDNESDPFCGLEDPLQVYSGSIKESVQLYSTLTQIVKPLLAEQNRHLGECAAGSCYEGYISIECKWKTIRSPGRDFPDSKKVADPDCIVNADTLDNQNH